MDSNSSHKGEIMKDIKCPCCPLIFTSDRKYNAHLALEHEAFEDGENIGLATIASLDKKRDQVLFLLRKYKEARSPHNWPLFKQYTKWFSPGHLIVWDAAAKSYQTNPKEGWDEEQVKLLFIELEGVRRARQLLQAQDKALWHKDGAPKPHHCILPTEEAMVQARLVEEAYRKWIR